MLCHTSCTDDFVHHEHFEYDCPVNVCSAALWHKSDNWQKCLGVVSDVFADFPHVSTYKIFHLSLQKGPLNCSQFLPSTAHIALHFRSGCCRMFLHVILKDVFALENAGTYVANVSKSKFVNASDMRSQHCFRHKTEIVDGKTKFLG